MRHFRLLPAVGCLLIACGAPEPSDDGGAREDSANVSTSDGSSAMDAATMSGEDAATTMDTGSATDSATREPDSATSGPDSTATSDARTDSATTTTDARADSATTDARTSDVASMPDATSSPDAASGSGVIDFTARGYYRRAGSGATFTMGLPTGYRRLPTGLTYTQLAQLQRDCVDRINQYRAGMLRFSNGTADPGVPRTALNHLQGNNACSSAQAVGDMVINNGAGGCAGAHATSFNCPWSGSVGQNTCCMRTGSNYSDIRSQLYSCLQSMWDEGIGMPSNATFTAANGHWFNMRSSAFTQVSCGFGFDDRGRVWMNQDFSAGRPGSVAQTCSCGAVGSADGCGATCVAGP